MFMNLYNYTQLPHRLQIIILSKKAMMPNRRTIAKSDMKHIAKTANPAVRVKTIQSDVVCGAWPPGYNKSTSRM